MHLPGHLVVFRCLSVLFFLDSIFPSDCYLDVRGLFVRIFAHGEVTRSKSDRRRRLCFHTIPIYATAKIKHKNGRKKYYNQLTKQMCDFQTRLSNRAEVRLDLRRLCELPVIRLLLHQTHTHTQSHEHMCNKQIFVHKSRASRVL